MKKSSVLVKNKNTGNTLCKEHGVTISPASIELGEKIKVNYNGLLAKSGADQVYFHVGNGIREWRNIEDLPMQNSTEGWSCEYALRDPVVNFCFYDSAHNWDNNNGSDWSIVIS